MLSYFELLIKSMRYMHTYILGLNKFDDPDISKVYYDAKLNNSWVSLNDITSNELNYIVIPSLLDGLLNPSISAQDPRQDGNYVLNDLSTTDRRLEQAESINKTKLFVENSNWVQARDFFKEQLDYYNNCKRFVTLDENRNRFPLVFVDYELSTRTITYGSDGSVVSDETDISDGTGSIYTFSNRHFVRYVEDLGIIYKDREVIRSYTINLNFTGTQLFDPRFYYNVFKYFLKDFGDTIADNFDVSSATFTYTGSDKSNTYSIPDVAEPLVPSNTTGSWTDRKGFYRGLATARDISFSDLQSEIPKPATWV